MFAKKLFLKKQLFQMEMKEGTCLVPRVRPFKLKWTKDCHWSTCNKPLVNEEQKLRERGRSRDLDTQTEDSTSLTIREQSKRPA